jgi:hypothetical protein
MIRRARLLGLWQGLLETAGEPLPEGSDPDELELGLPDSTFDADELGIDPELEAEEYDRAQLDMDQ